MRVIPFTATTLIATFCTNEIAAWQYFRKVKSLLIMCVQHASELALNALPLTKRVAS